MIENPLVNHDQLYPGGMWYEVEAELVALVPGGCPGCWCDVEVGRTFSSMIVSP